MNFRNDSRYYNFWIVPALLLAAAVFLGWTPEAGAYSQYSVSRNATNCRACHGDFRLSPYVSMVDGQSWGDDLHDRHRTVMLNGDCAACHVASGRFPVPLDSSSGGTGLQPLSCVGCHGRSQDAGHDNVSGGLGAGLRQHHTRAGENDCVRCHSDADPANYTPVDENVKPSYYASPGTNHLNMPTDPCNLDGRENFGGSTIGLDNDGDDLWDAADPGCGTSPAPSAVSLSASPGAVSSPGTAVTLTAAASGGSGSYEYRFWLFNGTSWSQLRAYGPSATAPWTPSAAGTYSVQVWARNTGATAEYQTWGGLTYMVGAGVAPATDVTLSPGPASPASVGTPITFTAAAGGGSGTYEYEFWLYDGTAWSLLQGYGQSATAPWTPSAAGTYSVQAWARSVGSPTTYDTWTGTIFVVTP